MLQCRIKETDFSFLYGTTSEILIQVSIARTTVFKHERFGPTDQITRIFLSLNLNTIDFLRALHIRVVLEVIKGSRLFSLLWEDWRVELVLSAVQLNVQQLINDVAYFLAMAW